MRFRYWPMLTTSAVTILPFLMLFLILFLMLMRRLILAVRFHGLLIINMQTVLTVPSMLLLYNTRNSQSIDSILNNCRHFH
jgi:uncharacterized SAM-binding protein YcdF (DUF218 family)